MYGDVVYGVAQLVPFANMNPKKLDWLLIIAGIFFIVPLEGKQRLPSIFGSAWVQWGTGLILAVLIGTGLFLSVHAVYTRPETRKHAPWSAFGFALLFLAVVSFQIIGLPMFCSLNNQLKGFSSSEDLPRFLRSLQSAQTVAKRSLIAGLIYRHTGASVPYMKEDGIYTLYEPNQEDKNGLQQTKEYEIRLEETKKMIGWQIVQMPFVAEINILLLFFIFFVGIFRHLKKTKKSEQDDGANDPQRG